MTDIPRRCHHALPNHCLGSPNERIRPTVALPALPASFNPLLWLQEIPSKPV